MKTVTLDERGSHTGLCEPLHGRRESVDLNEHQGGTIDTAAEQGRPGSREAAIGDRLSAGNHPFR